MDVSAPHIMDVMIGVCAGSPPHLALCVCSVQERIGTHSGTYRNVNKMATLGQEWETKRNWTSPLCDCSVQERIGTYSGTYRNGNKMATLGQRESKRNWTSPPEAVGPYPLSQILWTSCTECVGTMNIWQLGRLSRGLYGTYRNVYLFIKVFDSIQGTYTERIRDV